MKQLLAGLLTIVVLVANMGCRRNVLVQRTNWVRDESVPTNMMRVLCVDADGNPVGGAALGWLVSSCDHPAYDVTREAEALNGVPLEVSPQFKGILHSGGKGPVQVAGDDGVAELSASNLSLHIARPDLTNVPDQFVVLDPTRRIGGFVWAFPSDLGCRCAVTLMPLRVFSGQIMAGDGSPLTNIKTVLMPSGHMPCYVAEHQSYLSKYDFAVPSGEYELWVCDPKTNVAQTFHLSVSPSTAVLRKDIRLRRLK